MALFAIPRFEEHSGKSRERVGRGTATPITASTHFPLGRGRGETEEPQPCSVQVLEGMGEIPPEPAYLSVSTPKFPAFESGQDREVFSF